MVKAACASEVGDTVILSFSWTYKTDLDLENIPE